METETIKTPLLLGDFVTIHNDQTTGMIVGLAKTADNYQERIFKVLIVGSLLSVSGIVNVPCPEIKRMEDGKQEICRHNYSLIFLRYAEWTD